MNLLRDISDLLFLQRLLHQDQVVHAALRDRIVECSHVKYTELVTKLFCLLLDIKQFFLRMERLNRLRLLLVRQTQNKSFLVHL